MSTPRVKPTQLRPPVLSTDLVVRQGLLQRLRKAGELYRLTLLNAPLGYGKSTLLAQYAAELQTPFLWYRVEAGDNSASRLLAGLQAALSVPEQDDEEALWCAILQRLDGGERFTVLLDDLHCLQSTQARRYLEELVRYPAASLRIIAASEGRPTIAFNHLRRDQQLAVFETRDLAVDSDEIRQLAKKRGVQLEADAVYQLRAHSEGWISGVLFWLAACKDQSARAKPSFDTLEPVLPQADSYIEQFFEEDLFRRLPPGLVTFMERTSVVQAFGVELAARLSGHGDAWSMIRRMERNGLFVQACQPAPLEYRYHPALRRALYQRVQRRDVAELRRLHRLAADCLLQQHCYADAIYQLMRAREYSAVLATAERHIFDLLREGAINTIIELLESMPDANREDHYMLAIMDASTVHVSNDVERARGSIQRLRRLLKQMPLIGRPEYIRRSRFCAAGWPSWAAIYSTA
ncbi:AAA family ATPase [Alkalilimnicola ehrlichii]|uniref:AAA family ATPase n=1 Tax=Alkalilimnicola ehrlichii TaxID=351052 RepID=UPI0011C0740D|nr:AAA family ATPase [Alkalilimnicola ehrlichii]